MPAPFVMKPLEPDLARRYGDVAARFARAFRGAPLPEPTSAAHKFALAAHRFGLGPGSVARTARRATQRKQSLADLIVSVGTKVRREAAESGADSLVVDATAPGALVCAVLSWRAELGREVCARVTSRSQKWLELSREALEPLTECGEVTIEEDDGVREAADDSVSPRFIGGDARACVIVAPYYYSKGDLDRMALELALELACPCPDAEGGLELLLPRGWDQRERFLERLDEFVRALESDSDPARPHTTLLLEASDAQTALELAVAHPSSRGAACSLFVYPMWRERPAVEKSVSTLADERSRAIVINHAPSLRWTSGLGATMGRVCVDADQRLRWPASQRAAVRHAEYELAPTVGRAVAVALSLWTGL